MSGATAEQLNALSKPVPPVHIRKDDRGNAHTTARFVMNRLDSTVGRANWRDEYRKVTIEGTITMECTLYIRIDNEWVGKTDNGGPPETFSKEKSLYSNALKRAGFKWGIARELYGEGNVYEVPEPENDFDDQPEPYDTPQPAAIDAATGEDSADRDAAREMGVGSDGGRKDPTFALFDHTFPFASAHRDMAWADYQEQFPKWNTPFWNAVKNLLKYADNKAVHKTLEVESVKDWSGGSVADLWLVLCQSAPALSAQAASVEG